MSTDLDDVFVDRLAALDEALADGHTPSDLSSASIPDELHGRLKRGLAALQALRHVRSEANLPTIDASAATTLGATPAGPVPMHFGRFHIIRELGRGGFGIVFLARDPKLHRDVALKVPHAQAVMDSAMRERFRREAQAAAGLEHPNIITVYEVDEQGPVCALVSAYCPSVTLAEWLMRQKTPVGVHVAARLVADLADAISYAHTKGVLHRDLKPANILVVCGQSSVASENQGNRSALMTAKITDFGLAKLSDESSRMTRSGAILGTPAYMAPEQARGKNDVVDVRADIYALGGILYEVLTGRPPFRGESDVDTLKLVCDTEPISPRQLRPKLPRDLETICLKCLDKEPRRRYASASELHADLQRFLSDVPVMARPISQTARVLRWCRRHPAVSGLSIALVFAVAIGSAGMTTAYGQAKAERNTAMGERNAATAERDLNGRLLGKARESITEMIDRGHQLVHQPGTVREGLDMLEVARRYYTGLLNETPGDAQLRRQAMLICRRLGTVYFERQDPAASGAWEEAARHGETLLDRSDGDQYRTEYLTLVHSWAENLFVREEYDAVYTATERALSVARAAYAEQVDDPSAAWDLHGVLLFRGMAARKAKKWPEAELALREGLSLLRTFGDRVGVPKCHLAQANYLNQLSLTAAGQEQLTEAISIASEGVTLIRTAHAAMPTDPNVTHAVASALSHLGRAQYSNKEWQNAVDSLRESNKIFIDGWPFNVIAPGSYFCVALNTKCIASALGFLERKDDSIPDLKAMIELPPPRFRPGRNDPLPADLFECYARLAALHLMRGEIDDAKRLHAEAIEKLAAVPVKTAAYGTSERWLAGVAERLAAKTDK